MKDIIKMKEIILLLQSQIDKLDKKTKILQEMSKLNREDISILQKNIDDLRGVEE